ncbi:MAG: membrane protein insertase YidC [Dehalococcoidia bacterium]|nr:membrane protein insertase YidC [Dehalococcoidia bacterium]
MEILGILWDQGIMRPMINSIALLYDVLFNNFGLSIIVFTAAIRIVMIPLAVRQMRQMKKMSELQPKIKALQEKSKQKSGREDRQAIQRETMKLYKEAGVNPVGCLGPFFLQIPIWIGLYNAILRVVPPTPEGLANLSGSLYSWNPAANDIPFNARFIGMDLVDFVQASPVPYNILFPVLVGASMWLQQKLSTPPSTDPRQAQTNAIMLWTMPVMFGFFTLQFPAGLALYILFSNILGIVIQYFIAPQQSKDALRSMASVTTFFRRRKAALEIAGAAVDTSAPEPSGEKQSDGNPDIHGEDGGRGDRGSAASARRQARRRRHNRR